MTVHSIKRRIFAGIIPHARLACVVVPDHPHRVTQRGNGRVRTFFDDSDYALYRDLLAANCRANGLEVWTPPRALAGRSATMTQRPYKPVNAAAAKVWERSFELTSADAALFFAPGSLSTSTANTVIW